MAKLNKTETKPTYEKTSHKNYMGGDSWNLSDPFIRLRMVAASSFFGEPKYYNEDGTINSNIFKNENELDFKDLNYIFESLGEPIFKPQDECEVTKQFETLIDDCLNVDVEKTLQLAVSLRNEDLIRSTPQVILVRAAMHKNAKGTGLITKYIDKICTRADEPACVLSYLISTYGKDTPIPNSLKKGLKKVLESYDTYQLSNSKFN